MIRTDHLLSRDFGSGIFHARGIYFQWVRSPEPRLAPGIEEQGGFKKKRNCSSRRKETHFEENHWNRASLRRLLRILESALIEENTLDCGGTTPLLLHAWLAPAAFDSTAAFALPTVQEKRGHVPAVQSRVASRTVADRLQRRTRWSS